jgi:hypothetical protein
MQGSKAKVTVREDVQVLYREAAKEDARDGTVSSRVWVVYTVQADAWSVDDEVDVDG